MRERRTRILLVVPDAGLTDRLAAALTERFHALITGVADAPAALDADLTCPYDLVIADMDLGDFTGVQLAEHLVTLGDRPIILLGAEPLTEDVIEALRLGVCDVLNRPFPIEQLLDAVQVAVHGAKMRRAHLVKYRGMRDLVRRVIRERRDLNKRIDLLCRDLVSAQRRLMQRVLMKEQAQTRGGG